MSANKHEFKNSSSIKHIDYHEPDTLEVCFANGGTYHYPNCPKKHYEALKAAESPGKHFQQYIRQFPGKKIS